MARKKIKKTTRVRRSKNSRSFMRALRFGVPSNPRKDRIKRRRNSKYRRSSTGWMMNSPLVFSKIDMRDSERVWLDCHAPHIVPTLERVPGAEHYPSYKKGMWDGNAYFVRFTDRDLSQKFKGYVWELRL